MALSDPRLVFGVHSCTVYNRTNSLPFGELKVLQSSSLSLEGEQIALNGGSFRFPWGVEDGNITANVELVVNEMPDFLDEIALGKAPTANAAEAAGNCSALTDKLGTVVDATTGIASVSVKTGSEADLKFTKYIVRVLDATTVDVYAMSDIDFNRGTDKVFENDSLKITASPLTIVASTAVEIPGYGIELTGGSGTINLLTAGAVNDTATFEVRPINSGSSIVTIGGANDIFPAVGLLMLAQQSGSGAMYEIDCFNVKLTGLPHPFNTKAFLEATISGQAFSDSARGGVFSKRAISI